ncbi:serine-type peptidase-like protein [Canariomyces notabilis]|uniref:Serine-type peptidase-like protein n=1 Tax=Canariomyces notabilis TaxID=2074819 RepID=A0AAN6QJ10_9PEZI|nr:serine-type peptidase-like protein [Canariomyces arenarius]
MRLPRCVAAALSLAGLATAAFHHGAMDIGPEDADIERLNKRAEEFNGWGTFDQLIDHSDPSLGTFKQRYWYGTQYWKGPGSPVYLINPGEQTAEGFNRTWLTDARLSGLLAQRTGGAVVVVEHRYWGESLPYANLTVENLRYLTLDNSLKDMTYFAKNFVPPFDTTGASSATQAPWIFMGGSYSGALAGWLAALEPGTFWAYYSSSGVVEAVGDFWQYWVPVQEATPRNCSSDVQQAINYVDLILTIGSPKQKRELKNKFMLGDLTDQDFASALEWGPWEWQSTQFYSENRTGYSPYYRFCDYIEGVWPNSTNAVPGAKGVGLTKALENYAKYVREQVVAGFCEGAADYPEWKGQNNTNCFKNQDPNNVAYKDLSSGNWVNRQWWWMLCNEPFEWWQDGAPITRPSIASRLVDPEYWRNQCPLLFPRVNGKAMYSLAHGKRARDVNKWTGGWDVTNTTRAMHTNGERDPWRDATLSSIFRPGGPVKSTEQLPVRLVKGGTHCSDLYQPNWQVNEGVKKLVGEVADNMERWVSEFYEEKGKQRP